jgi:hypothetical protein
MNIGNIAILMLLKKRIRESFHFLKAFLPPGRLFFKYCNHRILIKKNNVKLFFLNKTESSLNYKDQPDTVTLKFFIFLPVYSCANYIF